VREDYYPHRLTDVQRINPAQVGHGLNDILGNAPESAHDLCASEPLIEQVDESSVDTGRSICTQPFDRGTTQASYSNHTYHFHFCPRVRMIAECNVPS
jgi:hypothetical protein